MRNNYNNYKLSCKISEIWYHLNRDHGKKNQIWVSTISVIARYKLARFKCRIWVSKLYERDGLFEDSSLIWVGNPKLPMSVRQPNTNWTYLGRYRVDVHIPSTLIGRYKVRSAKRAYSIGVNMLTCSSCSLWRWARDCSFAMMQSSLSNTNLSGISMPDSNLGSKCRIPIQKQLRYQSITIPISNAVVWYQSCLLIWPSLDQSHALFDIDLLYSDWPRDAQRFCIPESCLLISDSQSCLNHLRKRYTRSCLLRVWWHTGPSCNALSRLTNLVCSLLITIIYVCSHLDISDHSNCLLVPYW